MHKKSESSGETPFQEKIVVENFFTGAGRGELLAQMQEAVQNGSAVIVLTGDEGCGKTMMCRMLEHETPAYSQTVLFPRTVESFENVVQSLALELGLILTPEDAGKGTKRVLGQVIEMLNSKALHLIIIFDEAENIYLATLERIRKMLDQIIDAGASAHMVFSGRKTFLENCEQLTICDFQQSDEVHFELSQFSEADTFEYLKRCSESMAAREEDVVFTDELVKKIFDIAKGNVRMTNILAEESLKTKEDDTSFMVLLDSVTEDVDVGEEGIDKRGISGLIASYSSFLPWIGGLAMCFLLLLYLAWPDSGEESVANIGSEEKKPVVEKVPEVVVKKVPIIQQQKPLVEKSQDIPAKEIIVLETPPAVIIPVPEVVVPERKTEIEEQPEKIEIVVTEEKEKPVVPIVKIAPKVPVNKIIVLRQVPPLKRKVGSSAVTGNGTKVVQPQTEAQKVTVSNTTGAIDKLYEKRMLAGAAWERGEKNHLYTVQLMVLTAENAEMNLKKMLDKNDYRNQVNQFFILKKGVRPEVIALFYGEYSSMAEARAAKNNIPLFLRKHKPYAIAIKNAVTKVKG